MTEPDSPIPAYRHGEIPSPNTRGSFPTGGGFNPAHVPASNPVGLAAFIFAVLLVIVVTVFEISMGFARQTTEMNQLLVLLKGRAIAVLVLSLTATVLGVISLIAKDRKRTLGAIGLGAGAYALFGQLTFGLISLLTTVSTTISDL